MVITGDAWSCVRAVTLTEWVGMTNSSPKVLIYSHDSFGLGHLRRCRTIAHALTRRFPDMSVLILSGSPIIGSFEFRSRVDFVRIPGVIKLRNGEYTPLSLSLNIEHILAIRTSIIEHTAKVFDPDILIVDKEPLGLRGEILGTLEMLKQRGNTRLILGLRDVMDDPGVLREEWTRKNVDPALEALYDEIWIYGPPDLHDPMEGMGLSPMVHAKAVNTGYLRRDVPSRRTHHRAASVRRRALYPGHTGRRRRRRRDGRLGDAGLRIARPTLVPGADRARPLHAGPGGRRLPGAGRAPARRAHPALPADHRALHGRRQGDCRDGRLQHVLRDPVLRQADASGAARGAAPRAVDPCDAGRDDRPAQGAAD